MSNAWRILCMVPSHQGCHCNFETNICSQGEEELLTSADSVNTFLCWSTNWNNQSLNALWTNGVVFKSVMHAPCAYAIMPCPYSFWWWWVLTSQLHRINSWQLLRFSFTVEILKMFISQAELSICSLGNSMNIWLHHSVSVSSFKMQRSSSTVHKF